MFLIQKQITNNCISVQLHHIVNHAHISKDKSLENTEKKKKEEVEEEGKMGWGVEAGVLTLRQGVGFTFIQTATGSETIACAPMQPMFALTQPNTQPHKQETEKSADRMKAG